MSMPKKLPITLCVNGQEHNVLVFPRDTLLSVPRDTISLTGTKEACGTGECASCSALIDGGAILSDLTLAVEAEGKEITTIEGLSKNGMLNPLQKSFLDHGSIGCGFCTPGIDEVFASSYLIKKDLFDVGLRTQCYLEPQTTVAHYCAAGTLHVWTSGMGTLRKRMDLAHTLNIPLSKALIHKSWVGGASGGKIDLFSNKFCTSLLSIKTGKPFRYGAQRERISSQHSSHER